MLMYKMHDHDTGVSPHSHSVEQTHQGDIKNPKANSHEGVETFENDWPDRRVTGVTQKES